MAFPGRRLLELPALLGASNVFLVHFTSSGVARNNYNTNRIAVARQRRVTTKLGVAVAHPKIRRTKPANPNGVEQHSPTESRDRLAVRWHCLVC